VPASGGGAGECGPDAAPDPSRRGRDGSRRGAGRRPIEVAKGDAIVVLRNEAKIERVYFAKRFARDIKNGLPQDLINQFVTLAHTNPDKVKEMLKETPALLSTRATWDELAIEAGAHMGIAPLTRFLADAGSPISTCTATLLGQTEVVKSMLKEDRNRVRERGAHDLPLLLYTAFASEHADTAKVILESGADPNVFGFNGTALHNAAARGYMALAEVLLEYQADVNAANVSNKGVGPTPLAVALRQKQTKMAEFLVSRGGREKA
jgi:hypothetical protein